jgi:hypothetical protein
LDPAQPEYVGNEAEEIDRNWDALILRELYLEDDGWGRNRKNDWLMWDIAADIYISDEEARGVGGNLSRSPEMGKFKIEWVCLNFAWKEVTDV